MLKELHIDDLNKINELNKLIKDWQELENATKAGSKAKGALVITSHVKLAGGRDDKQLLSFIGDLDPEILDDFRQKPDGAIAAMVGEIVSCNLAAMSRQIVAFLQESMPVKIVDNAFIEPKPQTVDPL